MKTAFKNSAELPVKLFEFRTMTAIVVKILREESGMSLQDLSKKSGLTISTLNRTETGLRDLSLYDATLIERALGLQVGEITNTVNRIPQDTKDKIVSKGKAVVTAQAELDSIYKGGKDMLAKLTLEGQGPS